MSLTLWECALVPPNGMAAFRFRADASWRPVRLIAKMSTRAPRGTGGLVLASVRTAGPGVWVVEVTNGGDFARAIKLGLSDGSGPDQGPVVL